MSKSRYVKVNDIIELIQKRHDEYDAEERRVIDIMKRCDDPTKREAFMKEQYFWVGAKAETLYLEEAIRELYDYRDRDD